MILLIRKKNVLLVACICFLWIVFSALLWGELPVRQSAFGAGKGSIGTVVIDAGHGGEDGGAVSVDGIAESHINLAISFRVNDLFRFFGIPARMTRTSDVMLSEKSLDTIHERKASDIRNRVSIVNGTPNAVLLSIHQNSLPSSRVTHGAQVFWNHVAGAGALAQSLQNSLNSCINTERAKQAKQISDTIYLMKHATVPSVLVECGFLSNAAETIALQDGNYQIKMASAIVAGYLLHFTGEEAE